MATITEAALQGEWFYLEGEEPLNRARSEFFVLRDGAVRSSTHMDLVGTYLIAGERAVLTFVRRGRCDFAMTLQALGDVFDETSTSIQADATYGLDDVEDPSTYYGTFVRRLADYSGTDDVRRRVG
jgi:hypothetical protein